MEKRTLTLETTPIDTRSCDQYIVDDGEDAFTSNPIAIFTLYLAVR